mmetsp:Transcript_4275/g.9191  ORF Transcript_4275/g.9191 Transcript_4275/m.9191 type:complete len:200 (+) Transcript_4275:1001-1600(+)
MGVESQGPVRSRGGKVRHRPGTPSSNYSKKGRDVQKGGRRQYGSRRQERPLRKAVAGTAPHSGADGVRGGVHVGQHVHGAVRTQLHGLGEGERPAVRPAAASRVGAAQRVDRGDRRGRGAHPRALEGREGVRVGIGERRAVRAGARGKPVLAEGGPGAADGRFGVAEDRREQEGADQGGAAGRREGRRRRRGRTHAARQ